jgi:hypothetical protein
MFYLLKKFSSTLKTGRGKLLAHVPILHNRQDWFISEGAGGFQGGAAAGELGNEAELVGAGNKGRRDGEDDLGRFVDKGDGSNLLSLDMDEL